MIMNYEEFLKDQGLQDHKASFQLYKNYKHSFMPNMRKPLLDALENELKKVDEINHGIRHLYTNALSSHHILQWLDERIPDLQAHFYSLHSIIRSMTDEEYRDYFLGQEIAAFEEEQKIVDQINEEKCNK